MRERVKIRFRLLGPRLTDRFVVSVARRAPRPFKISPQKGRALLAYLAMQPEHFARREDLANLLWGDQVDEYARHNLRVAVDCALQDSAMMSEPILELGNSLCDRQDVRHRRLCDAALDQEADESAHASHVLCREVMMR